jgi:hypothetical protein
MTSRSTARTSRRVAGALALAVPLLILGGPAFAQVPPLADPVEDAVETVEDVAGSDDPIGETIEAVDEAAGDLTGIEDPIEGPVDDLVDAIEDAVDDPKGAVDDVRGKADQVVETVDDATGGKLGEAIGGGPAGGPTGTGGTGPGAPTGRPGGKSGLPPTADAPASVRHSRVRADEPRVTRAVQAVVAAAPTDEATLESAASALEPGLGERLGRAAIDASKKLALPLGLTLVVLAYVVAQHWADRKDLLSFR